MSVTVLLSPSEIFHEAWQQSQIKKPVIILIGGYAGTGKSTLATQLAKQLNYAQIIPTGIFRSIAQTQTTANQNPALFLPTYDLDTLGDHSEASIRDAYIAQCQPVETIIKSVINFMAIEKQHLIIEGNHVLPWEDYTHTDCTIIELYLYVDDEQKHRAMLGGVTHNRQISQQQFKTGRVIDKLIRKEALAQHKQLFESADVGKIASEYVEAKLAEALKTEGVDL